MRELDQEYTVDFGHFDKETWYELMSYFQDANLYQAWSYDMVRFDSKAISHMILRRDNTVVAAAQVRIYRLPLPRIGSAYVRWGPMWQLKQTEADLEVYRQAVRALRNEFSLRRGFVLRINPLAHKGQNEDIKQILQEEGYTSHEENKIERTLIIDLTPSMPELRANLDQKWRNSLNRAEKNGLELVMGEEDQLVEKFIEIYAQMLSRKGLLEPPSDVNHLRAVQRDLPPALKLKVILCRLNGEFCSGAIFSAIGTTSVYLSGATSDAGLKTNGSYVVQWAFVKWLKENGFLHYDLNGINPQTNPGTYHFKRGLAGKRGRDVEFLGKFQVTDSLLSDWVVKGGEWLLSGYRRVARAGRSLHNAPNKGL